MNEDLRIFEELRATRTKYDRHRYIAPQDRLKQSHKAAWARPARSQEKHPLTSRVAKGNGKPKASAVMAKFCEVYTGLNGEPLTVDDLKSARRSAPLAKPRHVCMLLVRNLCGLSLPQMGDAFKRDHTTVHEGVRRAPIHMINPTLQCAHDRVMAFFAGAGK